MTKFIAVVAYDQAGGIAKEGIIPWQLPSDKWFYHQLIADSVIIRSRKVFGNKLVSHVPPRRQLVLSHGTNSSDGEVVSTVEEALVATQHEPLVYVCGGQDIYTLFAEHTTQVIATELNANYSCDRFFPPFHTSWESQTIAVIPATSSTPSATIKVYNR